MPMSSTRVWVTTTTGARDSAGGNARANGSTTRELRVAPLNTSARREGTSSAKALPQPTPVRLR